MLRNICFVTLLVCASAYSTESEKLPVGELGEYKIEVSAALGGEGFWDYLTIDSAAQRLYIARSNRIMIVDIDPQHGKLDKNKLLGEITGVDGAHGVALVPDLGRLYVSSGKDNSVRVIDLASLKETAALKAGAKPDAIIYDPASKMVLAFNNGGTTVSVIDPAKNAVAGEIELGGAPEFAVADGKGKVFVNIEDKSEVVELDIAGRKVVNHWPLKPGDTPTGLALDVDHQRLFSTCRGTKTMVVMDASSGKIIASLPIGDGADGAAFDPDSQNAFSSNGDGTLTIVHEDSPDKFTVTQTLKTLPGARTLALDPKTHKIWLVSGTGRSGPKQEFTLICVSK
jgi:YVTN family beta-propeller protein